MSKAIARFIPFSPYKIRLLADVVRGKSVDGALNWLTSYRTKRSIPLKKVIKSAVDNAENLEKDSFVREDYYVTDLRVDQGPIRKYVKPGAQGRANLLRRRYCHIYVELSKKNKKRT